MVYNQYGAQQGAGSSQAHQGGQQYQTQNATPIPGIPIRPPLVQPASGQVITHYEVYAPKVGCCECEGMTSTGMVAVILLFILLPPFCFIPCLMNECFEQQQRPVYGYPAGSSNQQYQQTGPSTQQTGSSNQQYQKGDQQMQQHPQDQQYGQGQQYPQSSIPVAEPVQGQPARYPQATQPPIQRHVNGDVV